MKRQRGRREPTPSLPDAVYCVFFSGVLELPDGVLLDAPPEAEPDLDGSLVVLLGELLLGGLLLGELLELEPGLVAEPLELDEPLIPEPELPPGLEGVVALLPLLVLPLVLLPA